MIKPKKIFLIVSAIIILAFFLFEVFSGHWILPQYFSLGSLQIRYYGIIMALAVLAAYFWAIQRAPKYNLVPAKMEDLLFWLIVGGFIGARLYHIASSAGYYSAHPMDMLKVWQGGLSMYGALSGGLLTLWIIKRLTIYNLQFTIILDWLTPSLLLGQIIGRFGNFFNYELYGYPTNLPWKMFVPSQFRPENYSIYQFFHPLFLYEAIGNVIILFLLLKIIKPQRPGALFLWYVLLYNALRFCLEFVRIDSVFIGHFRQNALVSLCLVLICIVMLLWRNPTKNAQVP